MIIGEGPESVGAARSRRDVDRLALALGRGIRARADDLIRAIASVRRIAPGLRIVVGGLGAPADIETRAAVRVAELETVVNDDLGHDIGDSTLTDDAQALASELRP